MTEPITPRQFHVAAGVEDWRVLFEGAWAHFRTGSFGAGVALVDAIGELADAANHHPDVDLRYAGVTVRLVTRDVGGLSERDVELARRIPTAARELGVVESCSSATADDDNEARRRLGAAGGGRRLLTQDTS
jgi:4a-hydroxytetrahydrobiopterin dehydratase